MNILIILNYYIPYVSGLTEYARLSAEELASCGNNVSVLACNHANLPYRETINGVQVYRAPIIAKISKGMISPKFISMAKNLIPEADVVNLHLPMLESGIISRFIPKEKLVCMYHCDINLPKSIINSMIIKIMDHQHNLCLRRAKTVMVTSEDYALHSRVAYKYAEKLKEVAAPVKEYSPCDLSTRNGQRPTTIGFCGRIVEEKGIEILIRAFEKLRKEEGRHQYQLIIGGDYQSVAGGSIYPRLKKLINDRNIPNISFPGKIPEEKMSAFFSSLDVFVLPSINSLEAFGMVQVEAMECGTPVVASDLYGVRTIIQRTGAGQICKAGDVDSLKNAISNVLDNREYYAEKARGVNAYYGNDLWKKKYNSALGVTAQQ